VDSLADGYTFKAVDILWTHSDSGLIIGPLLLKEPEPLVQAEEQIPICRDLNTVDVLVDRELNVSGKVQSLCQSHSSSGTQLFFHRPQERPHPWFVYRASLLHGKVSPL